MIKATTNKLINNEEIVESELKEVFEEIYSGLANEIQATSFLTALSASNINEKILTLAIQTSSQSIKRPFNNFYNGNLIENIALNKDEKYFDISIIQDLICSSVELCVSKYTFDSPSYNKQSFDILKLMGINIENKVDYNNIEFEKLNFNYLYLSNENPYFKYSESIRLNLPFDNILNTTSKMLNPLNAKNIFLGVNKKEQVEKYATICLKLQKNNSIIVCGNDSLPFISPYGESYVAEAWKNKIFTYELAPQHLDFKEHELSEILCENNEQNAQDILAIIYNKQKDAKYELSILNSALSLYISKKADSIMDGINIAKKVIKDGIVAQKYEQIKKFYN